MPSPALPNIDAYPIGLGSDLFTSGRYETEATLHLVADGYSSPYDFFTDCERLVDNLKKIAPFGEMARSALFKVYAYFESAPASYAFPIGPTVPSPLPSTPLGAYYVTSSNLPSPGELHLDYDRFVALTRRMHAPEADADTDFFPQQMAEWPPLVVQPDMGSSSQAFQFIGGAIVVLLPEQASFISSTGPSLLPQETSLIDTEHPATVAEPIYYAATTCNPGFERVAARALALKLGLGDESEQLTDSPPSMQGLALGNYPNLCYAPTPDDVTNELWEPKWRPFSTQTAAFNVHPNQAIVGGQPVEESVPLVRPTQALGFWEGGGGYSFSIYRPTQECLLRRRPGVGTLGFKASQQPFCPVCRGYLTKAFTGEYSTKRASDSVTLSTQLSEYDKVTWEHTDTYDATKPPPPSFLVTPQHLLFQQPMYTSATTPLAFWGYTCHVTDRIPPAGQAGAAAPLKAFYFDQVRVHQSLYYTGPPGNRTRVSSRPSDTRDVFNRVGFAGLKVTFENPGGAVPTDYTFAIEDFLKPQPTGSHKSYKLTHAWLGHVGGDHLYQTGFELVLTEKRPDWPCLEVTLSLVTRGPAPDFDPGGVAEAMKFYPQIKFRWTRTAGVAAGVASFVGTIHTVVNTKHYHYEDSLNSPNRFVAGHHMDMDTPMPGMPTTDTSHWNDVSCFTDANLSTQYYFDLDSKMNRADIPLPPPGTAPTWAALFDYYTPHVAQGTNGGYVKSFVGAYPADPTTRQGKVRKMYVSHKVEDAPLPGGKHTPLFITKFARQGGYDNLHVNGYMGKHRAFAYDTVHADESQVVDEDIVAAPFCGLDCFHVHWRWSLLSDTVATGTSVLAGRMFTPWATPWATAPSYRGWSATRSHDRLGAVLIPPNQQLDINIEAVTKTPDDARLDKIVAYKGTVSNPAPGENQVIMEQGMGWAMIESRQFAVRAAISTSLKLSLLPSALAPSTPEIICLKDPEADFYKVYDFIRFHHTFEYNSSTGLQLDHITVHKYAQVPEGTSRPTLTWPANPLAQDWPLWFYHEVGDLYNSDLYGDLLDPSQYPSKLQVLIEGSTWDAAQYTIENL